MKGIKIFGKIVLWLTAVIVLFGVVILIWLRMHSPGETNPIVDKEGNVIENSVAEIAYPEINGISQFVVMRGTNKANPILLMLHGGPGSPQGHMNLKYNKELEEHFLVVQWDQRGAGASFSKDIPENTMTIDQFIDDVYAVTQYLKKRFNKEKIFILGHSWGSYLGMRTIHKYPSEYIAYVGIGQVSDQGKSEDLSYDFVLNKAKELNNLEAIEQLESIGAPVNGAYENPKEAMMVQRNWVTEFGGAAFGKSNKDLIDFFIMPLLKFNEYKMADKTNYFKGVVFTQSLLWEQMFTNPLVDVVKEVDVPVYIFQGKHDYQTLHSLAETYIDSLKAPSKKFITFNNSAHMLPYNQEKDRFIDLMINEVLAEN